VTPDELELAQSYLTGSFALGFERASRRVGAMISAFRTGLPDDHLERLVASFAEVSAEDVRAAARAHLHPDKACLVAAGPVAKRDVQGLVG